MLQARARVRNEASGVCRSRSVRFVYMNVFVQDLGVHITLWPLILEFREPFVFFSKELIKENTE